MRGFNERVDERGLAAVQRTENSDGADEGRSRREGDGEARVGPRHADRRVEAVLSVSYAVVFLLVLGSLSRCFPQTPPAAAAHTADLDLRRPPRSDDGDLDRLRVFFFG